MLIFLVYTTVIVIPISFRRLICHGSQRSEVSKVYSPQLVRWFTAILAAYTIHLVSIWNDYITSTLIVIPALDIICTNLSILNLSISPFIKLLILG